MPMFEGKEYPYTDEGMAQLEEARKRRKQQEERTPIMSGFLAPRQQAAKAMEGGMGEGAGMGADAFRQQAAKAMEGGMGEGAGMGADAFRQQAAKAMEGGMGADAGGSKTDSFEAALQNLAAEMEGGVMRKEDKARHLDRLQALIDRVKHRAFKAREGGVLRNEDEEMYNSLLSNLYR